jgi:hypothetical protein
MNVRHRDLASGDERPITRYAEDAVIHPALSRDGRTLVFRRLFDFYRMDPTRPEQPAARIVLRAWCRDPAAGVAPPLLQRLPGTMTSPAAWPSATTACRSPSRPAATSG